MTTRREPLMFVLPALTGVLFFAGWEWGVKALGVSRFVLPPPSTIAATLVKDAPVLFSALGFTATIMLAAFALACISGIVFAVVLTQSRPLEMALWPYAVVLQVTPAIAIAPLILIWVGLDRAWLALLLLAWIIAFFPILSNTAQGLRSADHGLRNVFALYGSSRWKVFRHLLLPSALPYILSGVRISAGLALIGAVVAEFVAGTGGTGTGLAYQILQAGYQLNIPRMFAALVLITLTGVFLFAAMAVISRWALGGWHESEVNHD